MYVTGRGRQAGVQVHMQFVRLHSCMHGWLPARRCRCACKFTYLYKKDTHTHTRIYIYIYIHTHTYIHTHAYRRSLSQL